jgi:GNAT superfamily N-acetyltransferase
MDRGARCSGCRDGVAATDREAANPGVEPEWHGYLSSLYARGSARGRGIGSALLLAALDECDARGVDAIVLWPTPESHRLYTSHGFTVRDDVMSRRK